MAVERRHHGITQKTRQLLKSGEGQSVDFKKTADGVKAEDFVAFANHDDGGTVLLGVTEKSGRHGLQTGIVNGCDVSDNAILQILNKAINCIPPISVKVFVENTGAIPFIRLTIASSQTKPHSTPGGVYCIRDGSRNRALQPHELLAIFLRNEAERFAERFESSTNKIQSEIEGLEANLSSHIQSMVDQLGWSDSKLDDTEDKLDGVLSQLDSNRKRSADMTDRLRALLRQEGRVDPVKERVEQDFIRITTEYFEKNPKALKVLESGKQFSMEISHPVNEELTKEEISRAVIKAGKAVIERQVEEKSDKKSQTESASE